MKDKEILKSIHYQVNFRNLCFQITYLKQNHCAIIYTALKRENVLQSLFIYLLNIIFICIFKDLRLTRMVPGSSYNEQH